MVTFATIWESFKRRWVWIVVIAVACALVGAASSFAKGGRVEVAATYTAEFALYPVAYGYQDGANDGDRQYNYSLNESFMYNDIRRVALSEDVAGEVRKQYGTDLTVSSPRWMLDETRSEYYSRYVFIDVTGTDADRVLEAAQAVADKTVAKASELVPLASLTVAEQPAIKSSGTTEAADWGKDSFVDTSATSTIVETAAGVDVRRVTALAIVGFFGALVVFACYDIGSRRARTPRDVERLLDVPVVGVARKGVVTPQTADGVAALMKRNGLSTFVVAGATAADKPSSAYDALRERLGEKASGCVGLADGDGVLAQVMDADAVLLVIKQAASKGSDLDLAMRQLRLAGTPVLGALFATKR